MRLGLGVEDLGRFRLDDALRVDRIDRQLGAEAASRNLPVRSVLMYAI